LEHFFYKNHWFFHDPSGEGYSFCQIQVLKLDKINPQVAAYLAKSLAGFEIFDHRRKKLMQDTLLAIKNTKVISADLLDTVSF
jgi:aminopeptidase N